MVALEHPLVLLAHLMALHVVTKLLRAGPSLVVLVVRQRHPAPLRLPGVRVEREVRAVLWEVQDLRVLHNNNNIHVAQPDRHAFKYAKTQAHLAY